MAIIIGGSGSSGSTMLIKKLNTHPEIFSGDEINFFNKEQLFDNWEKNKLKIIPYLPYFSTKGWQIYRRNTLHQPQYGWSKAEILQLLKESNSINTFAEAYFKRGIIKKKAKIWIEKTPSNCYNFRNFLNQFPEGKVIHIARNPLDSVASMYRKDPRIFYAVGTWLYNNAVALSAADSNRYHFVKYEDLVYKTEATFKNICNFIGVNNEDLVFDSGVTGKHIPTWKNSPMAKISDSSMGSFKNLDKELQDKIYTAFDCFKISEAHIKAHQLRFFDYKSICNRMDYDQKLFPQKSFENQLDKELKRDKMKRSLKMYETGGNYFPLELKK